MLKSGQLFQVKDQADSLDNYESYTKLRNENKIFFFSYVLKAINLLALISNFVFVLWEASDSMKIVLPKVTLTLQCILHKSILWNILYQILYRIILSAYDCTYNYIIKKFHDINKSREFYFFDLVRV